MKKPLVSLVIVTYGQEELVDEAVDGALAQDYDALEILFSDDASPDETFTRLEARHAAYKGPHEFRVRRNAQNLGIVGNLLAAVADTRGELVVVGAGDDVSLPHRVSTLVDAYLASENRVSCLYSDVWKTDAAGTRLGRVTRDVPRDLVTAIRRQDFLIGASAAYHRRLFEDFPALGGRVQTEDIVMYLRGLMEGGVLHVPTPLVEWRISPSAWKGDEDDAVRRTGYKNGVQRALAYRQGLTDYRERCLMQSVTPDKAVLHALESVVAENEGFAALTRKEISTFLRMVGGHPRLAGAFARALRRYRKLLGSAKRARKGADA